MRATSGPIAVLHVDDEPDLLDLTATLLEREDERLRVESARSVDAGLDRLAEAEFDCVVSDYDMPGRSGLDFLEAVREDHPDLPFILFTGKGSEDVASDAISAGVTDYLHKQSGTEQYALLANRIANSVETYRSKRALERRNAELEATRERVEFMLDATESYIYELDLETGIETRYGAFERLFGVEPDEAPTAEAFYDEALHPDDRDRIAALQDPDALRDCEETLEYQYRTHPDNGPVRWLHSEAYVQHDAAGDPQKLIGLATDVTDVEQRKRELERYEEVVEAADDGIYVFDADARFVFVNQRVADASGIPSEHWAGEHVSILGDIGFLSDAEVADCEAAIRAVLDGDETEVRVELRPEVSADVGTLDLRLTPFRTDDGDPRVIAYSRDVTDHKERQRKLKLLQRRTQSLMSTGTLEETAEVAVAAAEDVLDAHLCGFHRVTDDGQRLEPVTATDPVKDFYGTLPVFERDGDDDPVGPIVWDAFDSGEPRIIRDANDHEGLAETPAGSGIAYPIADQGVFVVSATEVNTFDDTDERLIDILAATLTAAVQRVHRESLLRERERDLTRQNERLEEFASIVSHDLRNPLNVAQGRVSILRDAYDDDQFDAVVRAHDRMEMLIDDLLALAREGDSATTIESVSLGDLVERCWRNVETAEATLVVDAEGIIEADESQLQQLLENCVRNAVEHGGSAVTVTVGEFDEGFYVEDDGAGIPPDERDDVFEVGYSTSREGTGFGLRIVEQVAEAHDWTVDVTDGPDGGTRFEISGVSFDSTAA